MLFSPISIIPDALVPVPQVPISSVTRLAFRNRFTHTEKVAIEMASIDDPAAITAVRQASANIRVLLKDIEAATFVDLQRSDTRDGVMLLETAGVLAVGRALEILDTPIVESERPLKA